MNNIIEEILDAMHSFEMQNYGKSPSVIVLNYYTHLLLKKAISDDEIYKQSETKNNKFFDKDILLFAGDYRKEKRIEIM